MQSLVVATLLRWPRLALPAAEVAAATTTATEVAAGDDAADDNQSL